MDGSDPYADPFSIAHHLDFSPGHKIRAKVRLNFATSVSPVSRSHHFFLVVSFGRSSFRLTDLNASLALSACLGVAYDEIEILNLRDRVFKFSVSCKAVGFFIQNLRSYTCDQFVCYFHLWGFGGPNWIREEQAYYVESASEWISAGRRILGSRRSNTTVPVHAVFNSIRRGFDRDPPPAPASILTRANTTPIGPRTVPSSTLQDDHITIGSLAVQLPRQIQSSM